MWIIKTLKGEHHIRDFGIAVWWFVQLTETAWLFNPEGELRAYTN